MPTLRSRISFWWLAFFELVALATTGTLFIFDLIDKKQLFWFLAFAVVIAGVVFILVALISPDLRPRRLVKNGRNRRPEQADGQINQYVQLGRQLLTEERCDEAMQMFLEAVRLDNSNWEAYNYLGLTYSRKGLFEEAKSVYEKAISLEFDYASAHFNLAIAHEKLGEQAQAQARWERYLEVGEAVGERSDMLDHARRRIDQLNRKQEEESYSED